jgi:hypothetical protein
MRAVLLVACLLLVAGAMGSSTQSSAASQLASLAVEPPHSGPDKCDSGCEYVDKFFHSVTPGNCPLLFLVSQCLLN